MTDSEISKAIEVARDRLYYVVLRTVPYERADAHFFSVDDSLHYWPFFLDFGPLSLGNLYRFSQLLNAKLLDKSLSSKRLYLYSGPQMNKRANAVYLLAAYTLLYHGRSPEEAWRPFAGISPPLAPWHDASPAVDTFQLSVLDVLRGIAKARESRFFSFEPAAPGAAAGSAGACAGFDIEEYEHYERVENGDMNWLAQGRFLAFAGPHDVRATTPEGYHTTAVDDVLPYFRAKGVTAVVRLNKKYYNERRFVAAGIDHHDMYYLDGSNPPEPILQRFLATVEQTPGAVAVHCKAGLGRTGTCIGAYCMKHYRFTAREIIGWMRVCRPGSVIGPQQHYMEELQPRMWEEGEAFRRAKRLPSPVPSSLLGQHYAALTAREAAAAEKAAAASSAAAAAARGGPYGPVPPYSPSASASASGVGAGSSSSSSGGGRLTSGAGAMPGTPTGGGAGASGFSTPFASRSRTGTSVSPTTSAGRAAAAAGGYGAGSGVRSPQQPASPGASDMFSHLSISTGSGAGSGPGTPSGAAAAAAAAAAAGAAAAGGARSSASHNGGSRGVSGSPVLRARTGSSAAGGDTAFPAVMSGLGASAASAGALSAGSAGRRSIGAPAQGWASGVGRTSSGKAASASTTTTIGSEEGGAHGGGLGRDTPTTPLSVMDAAPGGRGAGGTPTISRGTSFSSFGGAAAAGGGGGAVGAYVGGGGGGYATPGSSPIATGVLTRARSRGASSFGAGGRGGELEGPPEYGAAAGSSGGVGRYGGTGGGAGLSMSPVAVPAAKAATPGGGAGYGYSAAPTAASFTALHSATAVIRTPTGDFSQGDALRSAKSRSPQLSSLTPGGALTPGGSGLRYAGTGVLTPSGARSPGFSSSSSSSSSAAAAAGGGGMLGGMYSSGGGGVAGSASSPGRYNLRPR